MSAANCDAALEVFADVAFRLRLNATYAPPRLNG
jgi:hypothetical protein